MVLQNNFISLHVNCFMFPHRITVEECKQRQRAAEEKEEMTRNTRSHLMAQVQLTESRLGRALEKRQMLMSEIM